MHVTLKGCPAVVAAPALLHALSQCGNSSRLPKLTPFRDKHVTHSYLLRHDLNLGKGSMQATRAVQPGPGGQGDHAQKSTHTNAEAKKVYCEQNQGVLEPALRKTCGGDPPPSEALGKVYELVLERPAPPRRRYRARPKACGCHSSNEIGRPTSLRSPWKEAVRRQNQSKEVKMWRGREAGSPAGRRERHGTVCEGDYHSSRALASGTALAHMQASLAVECWTGTEFPRRGVRAMRRPGRSAISKAKASSHGGRATIFHVGLRSNEVFTRFSATNAESAALAIAAKRRRHSPLR